MRRHVGGRELARKWLGIAQRVAGGKLVGPASPRAMTMLWSRSAHLP